MATPEKDKIGIEKLKAGWAIRITICGKEYKIGYCKSKKLCQILRDMIIHKLNLKSARFYEKYHFNEDQKKFMMHHSKEDFLKMVTNKTYIKLYNKFLRSRKNDRKKSQALNNEVLAAATVLNLKDIVAAAAEDAAAAATAADTAAKEAAKVAKLVADVAEVVFQEVADNVGPVVDAFEAGLKNNTKKSSSFLNVVVQSLWHLKWFKKEFLKSFRHEHVGALCVICALYDVFAALNKGQKKTIEPIFLRKALSDLYAERGLFQEDEMNEASETLEELLECLHKSSDSSNCANNACIAHSLFGNNISMQMTCRYCGFDAGLIEFTSFCYYVAAKSVQKAKIGCADGAFDKLLKIAGMMEFDCDKTVGGCGKKSYIHRIISKPQRFFLTVLGWQGSESANDILAILASITTEIDIGLVSEGLKKGSKYSLVSVVCYCQMHYIYFAYEQEHWVMYNDEIVKIIGGWDDVLTICKKRHFEPHILFFEAVEAVSVAVEAVEAVSVAVEAVEAVSVAVSV